MDPKILLPFTAIAAMHAAIPTHWLPFVLVGRAHGWPARRTLGAVLAAGGGHVGVTIALGLAAAWIGKPVIDALARHDFPVGATVLIAIGAIYCVLSLLGRGHGHAHVGLPGHGHDHPHDHDHDRHDHHDPAHDGHVHGPDEDPHDHHETDARVPSPSERLALAQPGEVGSRAAFLSLFIALTFSPCEAIIPIFPAFANHGWAALLWASTIMAAVTIGAMLLLTALTLRGIEYIRVDWLDRHERLSMGIVLLVLGLVGLAIH